MRIFRGYSESGQPHAVAFLRDHDRHRAQVIEQDALGVAICGDVKQLSQHAPPVFPGRIFGDIFPQGAARDIVHDDRRADRRIVEELIASLQAGMLQGLGPLEITPEHLQAFAGLVLGSLQAEGLPSPFKLVIPGIASRIEKHGGSPGRRQGSFTCGSFPCGLPCGKPSLNTFVHQSQTLRISNARTGPGPVLRNPARYVSAKLVIKYGIWT